MEQISLSWEPVRRTYTVSELTGELRGLIAANFTDIWVSGEISGTKVAVTREVDAGLETIEVDLPAVITVDLRLNEPRYVKLPDIMKAKKKPLDVTSLDALGVSAGQLIKVVKTEPPAQRQKGVMVKDVAELVEVLKKKGLI